MTGSDPKPAWDKGPWYDSDNPTRVVRGGAWRLGVGLAIFIAVVAVIGGISWGIGVWTSGTAGKGNVTRDNNSSQNREGAQAYFREEYGDIQAYQTQLKAAIADLKANPADPNTRTNYRGLYNTCVNAVTDYNNKSKTTLYQDWKDDGLPETIDLASSCPNVN